MAVTARVLHLIQATPALQARIYQLVWRDQEAIVQALLARGTARRPGPGPARDAELRARVITVAVSDSVRIGVGAWVQAGQPGPVGTWCQHSLAMLREALSATPGGTPESPGPLARQ